MFVSKTRRSSEQTMKSKSKLVTSPQEHQMESPLVRGTFVSVLLPVGMHAVPDTGTHLTFR